MEVSDAGAWPDIIPFRIHSFDINSPQYHRGVYNCIRGAHKDHINFNGPHDTLMLFKSRRKNKWIGKDSLYDAWLIVNYGECRTIFDMDVFER